MTPGNGQLLELITSTGIGGALALVMFFFYRKDANAHATALANLVEQYAVLLNRVLDGLIDKK